MKNKSGFTIVELLIVIVVIAILAAISIVAYNGIQQRARDAERASEVASTQKAIEFYRVDNSSYPLPVGLTENSGYTLSALQPLLVPKYLPSLPEDPSNGITYQYVRDNATDSYGIRVQYESRPHCHAGTNNALKGWWGISKC